MTTFLASILPITVFLIILELLNSFSLVKWPKLVGCICYGAAICGMLFLLSPLVSNREVGGLSIMPLLEEFFKAILVVALVLRRKIRFLVEALIYGAAVGGGFALAENVIYLIFNTDMSVGTSIFRGFSCASLHVGCTALIATIAVIVKDAKPAVLFMILGFIPSIILHYIHNGMMLNPATQLIISVSVFTILFIFLFSLGEKKIYKWMDHSISVDVQTLSSIKKGSFATTKAGMYLLDVKEQFAPEVFFDMIIYVELYLELKIEKQSRMLLSQAGFGNEDKTSDEEYNGKIQELANLRNQIGKTGLQVLGPLVQVNT